MTQDAKGSAWGGVEQPEPDIPRMKPLANMSQMERNAIERAMVLDGSRGAADQRAVRLFELDTFAAQLQQQFAVPVKELSGLIADPALLFRNAGLSAPEIVDSLPATDNFAGRLVFLTTDSKLYRFTVGEEWSVAVSGADVTDGTITGNKIVANTITGGLLATSGIITQTAQIGNGVIQSANIGNAQITNALIQNGAITNAKIGSLAVDTANIASGAITNVKIENGAITNAKIGNAAVDTAQIANAAITTAKIGTAQITNALIANAAIDNAKIGNLEVTNAKIANLTVGTGKVANNAISNTASATGSGSADSVWTTIVSTSFTASASGNDVLIGAFGNFTGTGATGARPRVRLLFRGSQIALAESRRTDTQPISLLNKASTGWGTNTLQLQMESTTSSTVTAADVVIYATELKK